jgi:hypothetical protein
MVANITGNLAKYNALKKIWQQYRMDIQIPHKISIPLKGEHHNHDECDGSNQSQAKHPQI